MKMLTKFQSKSSRAKAIAFHPKRPWLLVALYSSSIQLWDYRMGTIIDRFEGHEGPVRGIDFHPTQAMFVSGGDDYSIRVWSLHTRKLLFTLTGHLDYVRTVFFHHDLPWIISSSDDQTIRIWNWQNRQEIACLTGHNHYVLCAQFHPSEDLVVSASLDQTVRVWDISGLRKKHSAPASTMGSFEDQLARANAPQQDLFGNTDALVKYVLEGHDRGVNWAAFHPTLPLIVSGGDDRVLKLWRMSETKAWEVDTCRGHTNNVMSCVFHPFQEMILSVGEDKTVRAWDLKNRTLVYTYKRDADKLWYVAAHQTENLFATAHDSGVMVFKLERERPASAVHQNALFFADREKVVHHYEIGPNGKAVPLLSLKRIGQPWVPLRSMSYNPAERCILVTAQTDNNNGGNGGNGVYELVHLPRDGVVSSAAIEPTETLRGSGNAAVFFTRNRFAVFQKSSNSIEVRDLNNAVTKTIRAPIDTKDIAYGGGANLLLLLGAQQVVLYDVQLGRTRAEIEAPGTRYVQWSADGEQLALLAKHTIVLATKDLKSLASVHETIRIKSATWDDSGVLIYSTLNHLRYCLKNGDSGILRSLKNTLYVIKARGNKVYTLTRGGEVRVVTIDPTEYRFKRALVHRDFREVLRLIKNSQLVGQSIIAYLQKKGYPEIALQFVQDPQTKFDLAIECGDLREAFEQAKELSKPSAWKVLGEEALAQGNHDLVEDVYQKQRDFDKLAFMYHITGNVSKLQRMEQIAEARADSGARFQTSILLSSVENRIELLKEAGLYPLAYALAKSNGLQSVAAAIADEAGISADVAAKIEVADLSQEGVPAVVHPTHAENWPVQKTSMSFLEQALLSKMEGLDLEDAPAASAGADADADAADADEFGEAVDVDEGEENGWDVGDDIDIDDELAETPVVDVAEGGAAAAGVAETEQWLRSPVPADHIAAGSFESAAQLLNRQVGVVNFAPLKTRFLEVYRASKFYVAGNESIAPLTIYGRRNADDDSAASLPLVPGYDGLANTLQEAYKAVRGGKLELAIDTFRQILYTIVTLAVANQEEADECTKLIEICRNYILAFSIELKRRSLPKDDVKRRLELVAYFTKPKLQSAHAWIPLQVAMKEAFAAKNYVLAGHFATEFLKVVKTGASADLAKKIKVRASQSPVDAVEIDFDMYADFDVCPSTLTPIYDGTNFEIDPLTRAKYHASEKGKLCALTRITAVGSPAPGLRLFA